MGLAVRYRTIFSSLGSSDDLASGAGVSPRTFDALNSKKASNQFGGLIGRLAHKARELICHLSLCIGQGSAQDRGRGTDFRQV
jgi:hypothetical protein